MMELEDEDYEYGGPSPEDLLEKDHLARLKGAVMKYYDSVDWSQRRTKVAVAVSSTLLFMGLLSLIFSVLAYILFGWAYVALVTSNAVVTSPSSFGYSVWQSNIDNASPPQYECYMFFNLTNVPEVEQGGTPVYDEKGPYCYNTYKEKINIEWNEDQTEVTHQTYLYYTYSPNASFFNDPNDMMTNISPGYLGVLATAKGELQMLVGFTGPSMGFNIDWLKTVFVRHTQVDNVAAYLTDQQCYLSGCSNCDGRGSPTNCTLAEDFYTTWANSTTAPSTSWNGMLVSVNATASSGISMQAAQALFDSKTEYSLLSTKKSSTELWFNATTRPEVGPDWKPKEIYAAPDAWQVLADTFGITTDQAEMISNWLVDNFFPVVADPQLIAQYSAKDPGVKEISDLGWLQWGSCGVQIGSAGNLFHAGGTPEFGCFLFGILGSFSVDQSKKLMELPTGLIDMTQAGIFFAEFAEAALLPCPGSDCVSCTNCTANTYTCDAKGFGTSCYYNATAGNCFNSDTNAPDSDCTLEVGTGPCDVPDNSTVSCSECTWGDYFAPNDTIIRNHDCSSCSTGCDSCSHCDTCETYSTGLCPNKGYWEDIEEIWGLSYDDTLNFLIYWAYAVDVYGRGYLQKVMDHGGGLFMTRTLNEWIFEPHNPLIAIAQPGDPNIDALVMNQTSIEETETWPPSVLYTGKDDTAKTAYFKTFGNLTEIPPPFYQEAVPVYGNDGYGQFQPFMQDDNVQEVFVFDGNYIRTIELIRMTEVQYRGIDMWRFMISNGTFAVDPLYNNYVAGFANVTMFKYGSPIFFCNPHFAGVGDEYTSQVVGVAENQDWRVDWTVVDIEPTTGTVMHVNDSLQVNVFVNEPHWFNLYNPNVTTGLFYPLMWARDEALITNDDVLLYDGLMSVKWFQRAAFGSLFALGMLLIIAGILLAWHRVQNGVLRREEAAHSLLGELDHFDDEEIEGLHDY